MTDSGDTTEDRNSLDSKRTNSTDSMSSQSTNDAAPTNISDKKLTFFDRIIDGMNKLELQATNNPFVSSIRNRIDATRLNLQTDVTGGEGKQQAEFNKQQKSLTKKLKDNNVEFGEEVANIAIKAGEAASKEANKSPLRKGVESIGSGLKQFGKSALGFGITAGVQVANSGIKTGAVLFNATKVVVMAAGSMNKDSTLCTSANLKEEVSNLRKDVKSAVISYINTFAVATGVGELLKAKAGLAYSATKASTGLADSIGKSMGLAANQVIEIGFGKKVTAMTLELNKKSENTMKLRDPEMYQKLVDLRANHIDREGVSIEEKRAAAVVEKEMLETFRNNQNSMVGMAPRLVKSTAARVSNLFTKGTLSLTQEEIEKAKTEQSGVTKAMRNAYNNLSEGSYTKAALDIANKPFGAFRTLEERQSAGHKKIDHHTEELKKYLEHRESFILGDKNGEETLKTYTAEKKHEYVNLHRKFGKTSFSREI